VKQALQQGFASRSRWLLQILGLSYNRTFKRDMPGRETHFKLAQILLFYMDITLNV